MYRFLVQQLNIKALLSTEMILTSEFLEGILWIVNAALIYRPLPENWLKTYQHFFIMFGIIITFVKIFAKMDRSKPTSVKYQQPIEKLMKKHIVKKKFVLSFLFSFGLFTGLTCYGQDKYIVFLTDKNQNPYSLNYPQDFLSQRAIDRRTKFNISLDDKDLPVTPAYISQIAATGAVVQYSLKWINAVVIVASDTGILSAVGALPFVAHFNSGSKSLSQAGKSNSAIHQIKAIPPYFTGTSLMASFPKSTGTLNYGAAWNQISMIGLHHLHDLGYTAQGIMIAVLDAGFWDVEQGPAFSYLWQNNLIAGTRDFATPGGNVFQNHTHGESVLSVLGANVPGQIIGSAPDAFYWLIRTEDAWEGEYLLEEYNWQAGAELADSAGVDIITSSLAYTTYDNAAYNHSYSDLDGNTTPIAIASDIAASRGILVVNCQGNLGEEEWHYLSSPADGDSVFAVGTVNEAGVYQEFSGKGPTADGRIKPDVCAQGYNTAIIYGNNTLTVGTGTSFSTPIISGAMACLWQAVPAVSADDIRNVMRQTASNSTSPDNQTGWGIPDIMTARDVLIALAVNPVQNTTSPAFALIQNPFDQAPFIRFDGDLIQPFSVEIYSANGALLYSSIINAYCAGQIELRVFSGLPQGLYLIRLTDSDCSTTLRAIKK